jgi:hypothetical protein
MYKLSMCTQTTTCYVWEARRLSSMEVIIWSAICLWKWLLGLSTVGIAKKKKIEHMFLEWSGEHINWGTHGLYAY